MKPYTSHIQTGLIPWKGKKPPTIQSVRNVYVDLKGHLNRLPFDAGRDGLWRFDGQIFYLKGGQDAQANQQN